MDPPALHSGLTSIAAKGTPFPCSQCGSPATKRCKACYRTPDTVLSEIPVYCSESCERLYGPKHEEDCERFRSRTTLLRAAGIAHQTWLMFRETTWDRPIVHAERWDDNLHVVEDEKAAREEGLMNFDNRYNLPKQIADDEDLWEIVLSMEQGIDAVGWMGSLFLECVRGVASVVREITYTVLEPRLRITVASSSSDDASLPDGTPQPATSLSSSRTAAWQILLRSGEFYAVEVTCCAYGFDTLIEPWGRFLERVDPTQPFTSRVAGHWRHQYDLGAWHKQLNNDMNYLVGEQCKVLDLAAKKFQEENELNFVEIAELPEDQYERHLAEWILFWLRYADDYVQFLKDRIGGGEGAQAFAAAERAAGAEALLGARSVLTTPRGSRVLAQPRTPSPGEPRDQRPRMSGRSSGIEPTGKPNVDNGKARADGRKNDSLMPEEDNEAQGDEPMQVPWGAQRRTVASTSVPGVADPVGGPVTFSDDGCSRGQATESDESQANIVESGQNDKTEERSYFEEQRRAVRRRSLASAWANRITATQGPRGISPSEDISVADALQSYRDGGIEFLNSMVKRANLDEGARRQQHESPEAD